MARVKKAVIPAAGFGTRFLPATKTVPKELFPIVDRPILLYIVEECIRAGIEDIVLIAGRGKTAIEDFFDVSFELEATLERAGKMDQLDELRKIRGKVNLISVRQKQALGLGHAVLTAEAAIGDDPFAVLLGDEIILPDKNEDGGIGELIALYEKTARSSVAVLEVAPSDVSKYGIVQVDEPDEHGIWQVRGVVEKPAPAEAPSRLALPGRYVFSPEIFEDLRRIKPSKNGEFQLTDAMTLMAQRNSLQAIRLGGRRFDAGDKLGFLQANIEEGLRHPEIGPALKKYLIERTRNL